jgi:hypothetical protein
MRDYVFTLCLLYRHGVTAMTLCGVVYSLEKGMYL